MKSRHAGQQQWRGKREAFRAWRHSRPFWGGLLVLLAGLELLSIPLSGVLIKGQVKLVIYIGIGGVFGVLIGVLMVAAGIVLWANPTHRVFYGVAGIVLGIISFPASNLGGFFLGMLLSIIGGALAFAWTPTEQVRLPFPPGAGPGGTPAAPDPFPGMDATRTDMPVVGDSTRADMPPVGTAGWGGTTPRNVQSPGSGSRMLAVAAMPAVIVAGLAGSSGAARSASGCVLGVLCSSPSPSASSPGSSPGSSPAPAPSPGSQSSPSSLLPSSPAGQALPSGTPSPSAPGQHGNNKNAKAKQVKGPSGIVAPSATSVLTAKSSTMKKLNFVGVATLPVGGGGSEKALEFTASSASLSAVNIKVTQDGASVVTKTASLGFPDGLTLYTTKMCGQVEGIAPNICFTPDTASQVLLKLASALGKATPITMTNVTADQFLNIAGTTQWGALTMGTV